MPHRTRKSIYYHGLRRFTVEGGVTYGWTDEEKQQLKSLVDQRGKNWADIGKLLNKLADECKSCYERISRARDNESGQKQTYSRKTFSIDEDRELLSVVRKKLGVRYKTFHDVPDSLPWTAIAIHLQERKRQHKDYLRHWTLMKRYFLREHGNIKLKKAINLLENLDKSPKYSNFDASKFDNHILELMETYEPDEINWTEIDKKLNLPVSQSYSRWLKLKMSKTIDSSNGNEEEVDENNNNDSGYFNFNFNFNFFFFF